jgi:hypothetical protein
MMFDDGELEKITGVRMRGGAGHAKQVTKLQQERLQICPFGSAGGRLVGDKILNIPARHGRDGNKTNARAARTRFLK